MDEIISKKDLDSLKEYDLLLQKCNDTANALMDQLKVLKEFLKEEEL